MATETISDLRRLIRALRPLYLDDLGLVAALDMLVRETQDSSEASIQFQKTGVERRLSPDVELALYRISQEALNNIQRHAAASQVEIKIEFSSDQVLLSITDNGSGFEPPESPAEFAPSGHFGLLGLYERAELIGAKLDIRTASGSGTKVLVNLPLNTQ
jgi:signal transduction histidine kinase